MNSAEIPTFRGLRQRPLILVLALLACREAQHAPERAIAETTPPPPPPAVVDEDCISYRDTVALRGTLRREVHPGRPNYESIADGDEAETGFYLHLSEMACTRPTGAEPAPDEEPLDGVDRVQLVLDAAGYARLRPQLDHEVVVRGTLFSAISGHHHAPLLLQVQP